MFNQINFTNWVAQNKLAGQEEINNRILCIESTDKDFNFLQWLVEFNLADSEEINQRLLASANNLQ